MTASRKLEFKGHDGSTLAARLDVPPFPPRAHALFAHCFTCGKDIFAASRVSAELSRLGIAVLRFDFTGLGMSEGEFANTNFRSNVADLTRAAEYLRDHHAAPSLLIGHSLGGAAVLAAAGELPEVKAVATIGAPSEPSHVAHLFEGSLEELKAKGEAEVRLGGRPFRITRQFVEDIESTRLKDRIAALNRALLVMHSPQDDIVGIDQARHIYESAKHPKSFVSLPGADHLLRKRSDATYAARVLAAWADRYLPAAEETAPAEGEVEVAESGTGKFTQVVRAGVHRWLADEPPSVGGDNAGPGPYDLLLAGLGACTSMTLRMYAHHKQWPLERVRVKLRHGRVHAEDCSNCDSKAGRVDEIHRIIELAGDLDEAQRTKLLEIADKCPVHRTLHGEVKVRTELG